MFIRPKTVFPFQASFKLAGDEGQIDCHVGNFATTKSLNRCTNQSLSLQTVQLCKISWGFESKKEYNISNQKKK